MPSTTCGSPRGTILSLPRMQTFWEQFKFSTYQQPRIQVNGLKFELNLMNWLKLNLLTFSFLDGSVVPVGAVTRFDIFEPSLAFVDTVDTDGIIRALYSGGFNTLDVTCAPI